MKKYNISFTSILLLGLILTSAFLYELAIPWLLVTLTVVVFKEISLTYVWHKYALSYFMLIYLIWLLVVEKYSQVPINSLAVLPTLAGLPLVYLAASNLKNYSQYWKVLRIALILIGIVFGIWAVWQVYAQIGKGYAVGPLVDRNAFAAIINLLWFPTAFLFLAREFKNNPSMKILLGVGLFIISTALFATTSRGGIAAWLLLLPMLLWAGYQYTLSKRRVAMILIIASMAYFFSALFLDSTIADRSFDLAHDTSAGSRLLLWKASINMASAHPFLGTGWNTWSNFYPAFRLPAEIDSAGFFAHNDYLQFASEGGIFAALLLSGILFGVLVLLKRNLKLAASEAGFESITLLLGVLAICLQAGLNFIFYFPFINIVAGLYLARAAQLTDTELSINIPRLEHIRPIIKRLALGLLIVFITLPFLLHQIALVCLTDKYTGMKIVQLILPKTNAYNVAHMIASIRPKETISQNYLLNYAVTFMGDEASLANVSESTKREIAKDTIARFDITRRYLANKPSIGVREVEFLMKHQALLGGQVAYEKAYQVLQESLKTDPYNVKSMISLARLQAAEGHGNDAMATLQKASTQVLGLHDQQLIKVELLRQNADPKVFPELDAIEKDLQLVLLASEKGQFIKLPENYYEDIDKRLSAVSNSLK